MRAITILGMGPSAAERRIDIEKYCEGTEIWGLNNGYLTYPHLRGKWNRYFELHNYEYLKNWECGVKCHFSALACLNCDVWRTEPLPLVKSQKCFDHVKLCEHFGTNYSLGSPSLMLMLALYEHDTGEEVSEIRSWGIDTSDPSHSQQRSSWAFWISKAMDRGIKMTGTATKFFSEFENDEGLRGLREITGNKIIEKIKENEE